MPLGCVPSFIFVGWDLAAERVMYIIYGFLSKVKRFYRHPQPFLFGGGIQVTPCTRARTGYTCRTQNSSTCGARNSNHTRGAVVRSSRGVHSNVVYGGSRSPLLSPDTEVQDCIDTRGTVDYRHRHGMMRAGYALRQMRLF